MVSQMKIKRETIIGIGLALILACSAILMCGSAYGQKEEVNNLIENQQQMTIAQNNNILTIANELKNSRKNDYSAIQTLIDTYGQYLSEDELKLVSEVKISIETTDDLDLLNQKLEFVNVLTSVCEQRKVKAEEEAVRIAEEQAAAEAAAAEETYYQYVSEYTPSYSYSYSGSMTDEEAKEWIAQKESGGSYDATNGRYIGRYQLDSSYLNGDYSPENQEATADTYVESRYGSWSAAYDAWVSQGWY